MKLYLAYFRCIEIFDVWQLFIGRVINACNFKYFRKKTLFCVGKKICHKLKEKLELFLNKLIFES